MSEFRPEKWVLNGWKPIETAPKTGTFLVYMPEEPLRKYQVAYYTEKLKIIGNHFAWDLTKPTHWKEIEEFKE